MDRPSPCFTPIFLHLPTLWRIKNPLKKSNISNGCVSFLVIKSPALARFLKRPVISQMLPRIPGWCWGEDNDVDGVGIHNERFYQSSLWNYPPTALKDFMKLNLSSKRMGLVRQSLESTRGLHLSICLLSCKTSLAWNQRKRNHHLIFSCRFWLY